MKLMVIPDDASVMRRCNQRNDNLLNSRLRG